MLTTVIFDGNLILSEYFFFLTKNKTPTFNVLLSKISYIYTSYHFMTQIEKQVNYLYKFKPIYFGLILTRVNTRDGLEEIFFPNVIEVGPDSLKVLKF